MKGKHIILTILLLSLASVQAIATDAKRFSIKPEGGINLGHMSVTTDINEVYGGSLELALTSGMSLRGSFLMGTMGDDGEDPYGRSFENEFFQYSLNTNIYLKRPLGFEAGWFNPYFTIGGGRIHNDVETEHPASEEWEGVDYNEEAWFVKTGGGLMFKLGNTIDFFLQYQYHYSHSDLLDGFDRPREVSRFNDQYSTVTAGFAINIGSGEKHIAWVDEESDARQLAEQSQRQVQELRKELEERDDAAGKKEMDTLREEFRQFREQVNKELERMERAHDTMAQQVRERPARTDEERERERERDRDRVADDRDVPEDMRQLTAGTYYIIGGSFRNLDNAQNLRDQYRNQGYDAEILDDDTSDLFRVKLEEHTDEGSARTRLNEIRQQVENNAWLLIP